MAQVKQNSQGPPPRQRPPRPPRPQVKPKDGFDDEWVGRHVVILLSNGKELRGMLVDSSRYWLKIMDVNKNTLYINKAYVIHIVPST
jgi:RNase P/RNase MRP subunit p29